MNNNQLNTTSDDLLGKTALVTGAGQGMGRAISLRLARCGANLVINDLEVDNLASTMKELCQMEAAALAVAADVTDRAEVSRMVGIAREKLGSIDILVNNAGVLRPTRFVDITESEWNWVMGVNLTGTFHCTQEVIPDMVQKGWGRIINMSSTAGKSVSTMGGAHYTTAKTAILGLTRAVAKEVAVHGITVNAICPGLFDTEMTTRTISVERADEYASGFPIQRLGSPTEVADLVAFLASDRAPYITGASMDINGGALMV